MENPTHLFSHLVRHRLFLFCLTLLFVPVKQAFSQSQEQPEQDIRKQENSWWLPYGWSKQTYSGKFVPKFYAGAYLERNTGILSPNLLSSDYDRLSQSSGKASTNEYGGFVSASGRYWGLRLSLGRRMERFASYTTDVRNSGPYQNEEFSDAYTNFNAVQWNFNSEIRLRTPLRVSPFVGLFYNFQSYSQGTGYSVGQTVTREGAVTYQYSEEFFHDPDPLHLFRYKVGLLYEDRFQQIEVAVTPYQRLFANKSETAGGSNVYLLYYRELERKPGISVSWGIRLGNWKQKK